MESTWHITISGFLQKPDRPHGCFRLWKQLGRFRSESCYVPLYVWNESWGTVAQKIALTQPKQITIAAYSWGAGYGAIQLCNELMNHALSVNHLCLSDPVYKHPMTLMSWMALLTYIRPKIQVPPNVKEVQYFVQTRTRPKGFTLHPAPEPKVYENIPHIAMDDLSDWHRASLDAAARLHESP